MATSKKKTTKKTSAASKRATKKTSASKKTAKKAASKKTTSKKVTKKAGASKKTTKKPAAKKAAAAAKAPVRERATTPVKKVAVKAAAAATVKSPADLDRVGRAGRSALPRKTSGPRVISPAVRARKEAIAQRRARTGPVVRIQYYRSAIGLDKRQKSIVAGLGLRRLNAVRVLPDTPALRGMIAKVPHLVRVLPDGEGQAT